MRATARSLMSTTLAQAAIKAMDGTHVFGRDIQCSLARKRKEESKAVKNLKKRINQLESQNALLK